MKKEAKTRINFSLTKDNVEWLRKVCGGSGIPMSLFIDSLITGMRSSLKENVTENEAMALALEQIANGMRKSDK